MRKPFCFFAFTYAILLSSCGEQTNTVAGVDQEEFGSSPNSERAEISARLALDQLSQAEAIARKARVSDISYVLGIDLISLADAYQGSVELQFELRDNDSPLDVDFTGGEVSEIIANGQPIEVDYNGFFITLPTTALLAGRNELLITYTHTYNQDGAGLHRFVDPEDGNTYLYTYLWPYYSNRLFPNFDQPNLKARYELTVRAASDWQVVSAAMEDSVTDDGDSRLWHFPQSELFSSYIFSLHAGPYHIWEDMASEIPIRLLARESLASYVAVEEWMTYTKAGLAHYRDYFDIPYPFGKYDQVIVPDFLIGAMENVAAVTFSESFVDRGSSTRFNSQRRANTILHEMAHMWFGDLVTMNWWNGLWLNESFATLMAAIAVAEETEFEDLWHDFYLADNLTAIAADQAVSTHPIEMPVASTNDFFNVFDAITYEKGASVLNQLSHYIGPEDFRLGVSNYLKEHSGDNTELDDFIGALSSQSGLNLRPWAQDWMYQAGVNTLEARFSCEAGSISSFAILQTAPEEHPTLRNQRLQLGLFATNDNDQIEAYATISIEVIGAETQVPAAFGLACPQLSLPNYEGWGYTEVTLDSVSMDTIINDDALSRIDDPLLRSMIWTALFDAPENELMENATLLGMLIDSLARETNDRIMRQTLGELIGNLNLLERLGTAHADELATYGPMAEQQLWDLITAGVEADGQSGSTLNLRLSNYINLARSDSALNKLIGLLESNIEINGLNLGQNLRWTIIRRLSSRDHEDARQWLASEQLSDPSDAGRRAAISAEAALPDLTIKQAWANRLLDTDDPLPLSQLRAASSALFPSGQEQLQLALLPQLTSGLNELAAKRDNYYLQSYGRDLFRGICDERGLEIISAAIADSDSIGATLYKFMSVNAQRAATCVAGK